MRSQWRWTKVPRTVSWPDRRTGKPWSSRLAKARCSAGGPVDVLARLDGRAAVVDHPPHRLVDVQARRDAGELQAQVAQLLQGHGGVAPALLAARAGKARPLAVQPVGLVGLVGLAGLELGVEEGVELGHPAVDVLLGGHALADQAPRIEFARGGMVLDRLVHQGLGHGRVVALVVTEPAVAEHVDDHVLAELLAVFGGHLGGEGHRFGIVAVGVEDRRLDHQGAVGGIGAGAAVARAGGEADLVVDDEVDRPAGAVALDAHQVEALGHHALAGEGGVAVHQQAAGRGRAQGGVLAQGEGLFGARLAQHHRVDDLQVAGIGGQRQVDGVAVEGAVRRGAQMVFHIARALDVRGQGRAALELVEDHPVGLAHHRGQHVEPPAVGHADDDVLHAQGAAALDDLLQRRHRGLGAVEAEALGAGEALVRGSARSPRPRSAS